MIGQRWYEDGGNIVNEKLRGQNAQIISTGTDDEALTLTRCRINATLLSLSFIGKGITSVTLLSCCCNKTDEMAVAMRVPGRQRSRKTQDGNGREEATRWEIL